MNSQRLAQLHISPLRVQQVLFASLALLITLIACQQFQRWEMARQAAAVQHILSTTSITASRFTATHARAAMPAAQASMQGARTLASTEQQNTAPELQRWVF